MKLSILQTAPLLTIQDLGRPHARRWGVPLGGALDRSAHMAANQLVGNQPNTATLEITFGPCVIHCDSMVVAAVTGADMNPCLDGQPLRTWQAFLWRPGQVLELETALAGARSYLAIYGGLQVPPVLDSRSTLLNGPFPEPLNRPLRNGDTLPLGPQTDFQSAGNQWATQPMYSTRLQVSYWGGPHQALGQFERQTWLISPQSNRMGLRLAGTPLLPVPPPIASLGVCPGVIQLPPDGLPIVLLADAQTTGGYPIIGIVPSNELDRLAHLKPSDLLEFIPIVSTSIPIIPTSEPTTVFEPIHSWEPFQGSPI